MRPPDKTVLMEDHDKAYHVWKESGIKDRTLLHIDAHIDFGYLPDMDLSEILAIGDPEELNRLLRHQPLWNPFMKERRKMINIGNYIFQALKEGMIKRFYWVVPEPSWESRRGLRYIKNTLKEHLKVKRYVDKNLEVNNDYLYSRIFGKDVFVLPLSHLPTIDEGVLLDIDVDFLLTGFIRDGTNPGRTPWILPEQLIERLASKVTNIDILTIAYSVEGGFTPLRYKYLGEELRLLFSERLLSEEDNLKERIKNIMQLKRKAIEYEKSGDYKGCINTYEDALRLDEKDASIYYNLCLLYLNQGEGNLASHFYQKAIQLDPSYKTPYNNDGIIYEELGKIKEAENAYKRFLSIDPENVSVLNGLGRISLSHKRFKEAERYFNQSLEINRGSIDALLGLGITYFRSGRFKEAEGLFLKAKDIESEEPLPYLWLAKSSEKIKDTDKAIGHYKQAVMYGLIDHRIHFRLFYLYLRKGFYYCAWDEIKRAIKLFINNLKAIIWTKIGVL